MVYLVWVVGRFGGLNVLNDSVPDALVLDRVHVEGPVHLTEESLDTRRYPRGIRRVHWEALDREEVVEGFGGHARVVAPFGVNVFDRSHLGPWMLH